MEKCCIVPRPTEKCATANESGGISRIVFAACDVNFNDIKNVAEWCYLVKQGKIIVTNEILGKKDKANYTTKMVSSCRPEVVTGKTNTITYTDYLLDNQEYKDVKFYNTIQKNARHYKLGFIKCDGKFYGLIDKFSVKIDKVIEDTVNACTYWDIELSWNGVKSLEPINIPNFLSYLEGNCRNISNFEISDIYGDDESVIMTGQLITSNSSTFGYNYIILDNIFNGIKVNGVFDSKINENGYFNITAPFVLGAKYYYGNIYHLDYPGSVGPPIIIQDNNNFIQYNPYPLNVFNFEFPTEISRTVYKYVAIRDYDIEGINQELTDFISDTNGNKYTDGVNYLYLYECVNDNRPLLASGYSIGGELDTSPEIPGIYTFTSCFQNGYGETVREYSFQMNELSLLGPYTVNNFNQFALEMQLQINGLPSNWINIGEFNNINGQFGIPIGNHILLLRNTFNGFINVIPFTTNCS